MITNLTNQEVYITADSRREAFLDFCLRHRCKTCPANTNDTELCQFNWLELKADVLLKPCPFCGDEAVLIKDKGRGHVSCKGSCIVEVTGDIVAFMVFAVGGLSGDPCP